MDKSVKMSPELIKGLSELEYQDATNYRWELIYAAHPEARKAQAVSIDGEHLKMRGLPDGNAISQDD